MGSEKTFEPGATNDTRIVPLSSPTSGSVDASKIISPVNDSNDDGCEGNPAIINDAPTMQEDMNIVISAAASIPDGDFIAWLQCAGSFVLFFNSWGLNRADAFIINNLGVYQNFYEHSFLHKKSSSDISWIGSIQAFLLIFCGVAAGPLYDHGYLRALIMTGSFLVVVGMVLTSISSNYWQVVLTQGIMVGLGNGCLFVPSIAILPSYFSSKRALAMGIAAAGSSIGWATRVIALIMLVTLIIPVAGMRMRLKPSSARRIFEMEAWKEPPFSLFGLGTFLGFMGLYVPFFYIQIYALEKRIVTEDLAFYLLPLLNAGSFFGRIIPNYVADKIGPFNTLIPCSLLAAVLTFAWITIEHSAAGLYIFCILYGLFSGTFVSLSPTVTVTLCPHMGLVGVRMGMLFVPTAVGLLIGNPIAGAVLSSGWVGLQLFCGASVLIATVCITIARVAKDGSSIKVRS
ncbi:uncharacterized protein BP5553_04367 [Venustampulla echinocandica]|uniref:Major facilitator superfamily (MFS) profile domain-containing protein n=1 Tax=Venustampulla echinocandica TaxID=2656787 RepID=A0A370TN40_9HELO|nr:uncharacterized protein BP5553_04367 [Venustampulla echinocandica]RDL36934.1 hypothetical protein BP5553_04367 [Venustampulla echinocandica]